MLLQGRSIRLAAAVTALTLCVTTGCGNSRAGEAPALPTPTGPNTDATADVHVRLKAAGASFPDAFYQEAVTGLRPVAPGLDVTYEAVGSSAGREAFGQGLSDFAGTDSLVDDDDPIAAGSYRYIPSVAASISVVVNLPGVADLRLDPDTLAGIFQADITRWDDPAIAALNPDADLPATEITVARRSDGSGTTKNFTRYLDRASDRWRLGGDDTVEWPGRTEGGQQNSGVAQIVVDTPGAIGYVDFGNARELGLTSVAIRNRAGRFVVPSIEATQAALDSAEIADDLTYDPLDAPGDGAYPITAPTYVLVRTSYADRSTGEGVRTFVRWLITEGADTFAADVGFAPIPARFRTLALASLDDIEIG